MKEFIRRVNSNLVLFMILAMVCLLIFQYACDNSDKTKSSFDAILNQYDSERSTANSLNDVIQSHLEKGKRNSDIFHYALAGQTLLVMGDLKESIKVLNKAISISPEVDGPHFLLAQAYYQLAIYNMFRNGLCDISIVPRQEIIIEDFRDGHLGIDVKELIALEGRPLIYSKALEKMDFDEDDRIQVLNYWHFLTREKTTFDVQKILEVTIKDLGVPEKLPIPIFSPDDETLKILELAKKEIEQGELGKKMETPVGIIVIEKAKIRALTNRINQFLQKNKIDPKDLFEAAKKGHTDVDINAKDDTGKTAIMNADPNGWSKEVKFFIENGGNVNATDKNGISVLMLMTSTNADNVRILIENGADVNARDKEGATALMYAGRNGEDQIVNLLIENGADVNAKMTNGWTTLMFIAFFGRPEIAKILIDAGADVNEKTSKGDTALIVAARNNRIETVNTLVKAGADVNAKDIHNVTALYFAARNGHTEIVNYLIENGSNLRVKDNNGMTPLMVASEQGRINIVKFLINKGADVNAKANAGGTALMSAAFGGHTNVVKLLIEEGADVNAKTNTGVTALMLAESKGHSEVARILKK